MEKNIEHDAVKEMRTVREELSERYWKNPELLKKEMKEIREKYELKPDASAEAISSIPQCVSMAHPLRGRAVQGFASLRSC